MIDTFLFDEICQTEFLEVSMNRRQTRNLSLAMIAVALVLFAGMGVVCFPDPSRLDKLSGSPLETGRAALI